MINQPFTYKHYWKEEVKYQKKNLYSSRNGVSLLSIVQRAHAFYQKDQRSIPKTPYAGLPLCEGLFHHMIRFDTNSLNYALFVEVISSREMLMPRQTESSPYNFKMERTTIGTL